MEKYTEKDQEEVKGEAPKVKDPEWDTSKWGGGSQW